MTSTRMENIRLLAGAVAANRQSAGAGDERRALGNVGALAQRRTEAGWHFVFSPYDGSGDIQVIEPVIESVW
jgi:hypothetical protein